MTLQKERTKQIQVWKKREKGLLFKILHIENKFTEGLDLYSE